MLKYGLKIKVFLFIILVFALLSFFLFWEFNTFIQKIEMEKSTNNTFRLLEKTIENESFSLITDAQEIRRTITVTVARNGVTCDTSSVDTDEQYAVLDTEGNVIAGPFTKLKSYSGVPVVERALHKGLASDGHISIGSDLFITAAVPFSVKTGRRQDTFVVFSVRRAVDFLENIPYPFPVQLFYGDTLIHQTRRDVWSALTESLTDKDLEALVESSLKQDRGVQKIDRWTHISSYTLPGENRNGSRLSFVALVRLMPGSEDYNAMTLYMGLFILGAVVISLLFSFIVTHEIEKVFINLASDLSKLRVGKKLVLKKYPHGAGVVVSSINHLISKYQKHGETNPGIDISDIRSQSDVLSEDDEQHEEISVPQHAPAPDAFDADDDEKTMVAPVEELQKIRDSIPPQAEKKEEKPSDPIEVLWDEYRLIKEKNGLAVKDNEQNSFTSKIKTNKATIIAKYNCSDVAFSIEEKGGKPVVKAKPIKE